MVLVVQFQMTIVALYYNRVLAMWKYGRTDILQQLFEVTRHMTMLQMM